MPFINHLLNPPRMDHVQTPDFRIALAETEADLRAAQALRHDVFVKELGAEQGAGADGLEQDDFDVHCDHMLLFDDAVGRVVGVYRLMRQEQAENAGRFYSESEYDLTPLKQGGKRLLELGRSCLAPEYRGGAAMYHLWNGLAEFVDRHGIDILFGVASFHGTDTKDLAEPLSLLHHRHLAPEELRAAARAPHGIPMDLVAEDQIDRRAAMLRIPALIKAYLRLGGRVGQGAWVDHAFNTTDVCLVLDTARLNARQGQIYGAR